MEGREGRERGGEWDKVGKGGRRRKVKKGKGQGRDTPWFLYTAPIMRAWKNTGLNVKNSQIGCHLSGR